MGKAEERIKSLQDEVVRRCKDRLSHASNLVLEEKPSYLRNKWL